jgi:hypothetical protein
MATGVRSRKRFLAHPLGTEADNDEASRRSLKRTGLSAAVLL